MDAPGGAAAAVGEGQEIQVDTVIIQKRANQSLPAQGAHQDAFGGRGDNLFQLLFEPGLKRGFLMEWGLQ